MRIGIDARFFGSIGKGLGRYTQKLIENLENIDRENHYFIFLRRENWDEYQPKSKHFTKVLADIPWYGLREQLQMPKILEKCGLDLVHFPHFNVPVRYRGKFVVTIHDLILFRYPTRRASTLSGPAYFFKKQAYHWVINRAIWKSEKIIAVSEYTKKDILKHFKVPPEKIAVTYEGVDTFENPSLEKPGSVLQKYGIMKPYILYVGNAYPHKNLDRLILVFRELSKKHPDLHLVLAGREDYFYRRLKKFAKEKKTDRIIFPGHIDEIDLPVAYREARLYVFPSLYEGFGLPPLEAMVRNVPVVSSNASCLPEILENSAYFFDPRGVSETAETIDRALTDNLLRRKLIESGKEQVKKYSWQKMARETLKIYKNCAR
ncbi:MAG: glycosyltransferase family 1 protein [Candidatus Moranbacteria bacterium]|nr:glycosyltransferase family 1 protein [Candidatus Moranbacteria bacterium]